MEITYITWDSAYRWCVTCPSLPVEEQRERVKWCIDSGMRFSSTGVSYWFNDEKDVTMFRLRWE